MATYSFTGSVQNYTVATTGTFKITAYGAAGGAGYGSGSSVAGGAGAKVGGYFNLTAGDHIEIVVGGAGGSGLTYAGGASGAAGGGGGGGTFVIDTTTETLLLVAGGGGGGGDRGTAGGNALTTPLNAGAGGAPGVGASQHYGGGGGGFSGGNAGHSTSTLAQPGTGAPGTLGTGTYSGGGAYVSSTNGTSTDAGGYGGGGGGSAGGGGGGGYGGGAGGGYVSGGPTVGSGGGGGGSLDTGTNTFTGANANPNGSVTILCFMRGTHILTPTGETFVEDLRIGDRVVTRFGGIQPIKWIGRQSHNAASVRGDLDKIPVCVRAGALGDQIPARDLYISPGHSMLVDGNLLIGQLMVNGVTVTQEWSPPTIDYFHIELNTHDCVIADGAWAETFADYGDLRERFQNAAEFEYRYPDQGPPPDELRLCAPRPEQGVKLDHALRPVVARAAAQVQPGRLFGSIDRIEGAWTLYGWAHDPEQPGLPVLLEVEFDGQVIGSVLACEPRADLKEAGFGNGRCAFRFTSPVRLRPDALGTLRVRRAADGATLDMHPSCQRAITSPAPQAALRLVA